MFSLLLYLLPPTIAFANERIKDHPKALSAFYRVVAFLGVLNFVYLIFTLTTFYTSCGAGRNSCSIWHDLNVNVPSQVALVDMILMSLLTFIYFGREMIRFGDDSLNAWQYAAYTVVGTTAFSLPIYFVAIFSLDYPKWAKDPYHKDDLVFARRQFIDARRELEKDFRHVRNENYAYQEKLGLESSTLIERDEDGRLIVDDDNENAMSAALSQVYFYSHIFTYLYGVFALAAIVLAVTDFDSVFIMSEFSDFYTNYGNRFIINLRILLWITISTRAMVGSSPTKYLLLILPYFSITATFAVWAMDREQREAGQPPWISSLSLSDYVPKKIKTNPTERAEDFAEVEGIARAGRSLSGHIHSLLPSESESSEYSSESGSVSYSSSSSASSYTKRVRRHVFSSSADTGSLSTSQPSLPSSVDEASSESLPLSRNLRRFTSMPTRTQPVKRRRSTRLASK
eukprot:TRINITY_DN2420_c0_g1_i1.p1 TRINITY_DN2420_c0_g1~~TRINITY_DN2420_c0_g1_i1.p1  ORF type:complete len:477 (-),score=85.19 TRINITY_DN2420_c0_g1_i1:678-2045(-)